MSSRDPDVVPPETGPGDAAGPPNPPRKRGRRKAQQGTVAILDKLLLQPRSMSWNGKNVQMPTVNVIVLQLMQKEMTGSRRARNVLFKYKEFAGQDVECKHEIRFADSDQSRQGDDDTLGENHD